MTLRQIGLLEASWLLNARNMAPLQVVRISKEAQNEKYQLEIYWDLNPSTTAKTYYCITTEIQGDKDTNITCISHLTKASTFLVEISSKAEKENWNHKNNLVLQLDNLVMVSMCNRQWRLEFKPMTSSQSKTVIINKAY